MLTSKTIRLREQIKPRCRFAGQTTRFIPQEPPRFRSLSFTTCPPAARKSPCRPLQLKPHLVPTYNKGLPGMRNHPFRCHEYSGQPSTDPVTIAPDFYSPFPPRSLTNPALSPRHHVSPDHLALLIPDRLTGRNLTAPHLVLDPIQGLLLNPSFARPTRSDPSPYPDPNSLPTTHPTDPFSPISIGRRRTQQG